MSSRKQRDYIVNDLADGVIRVMPTTDSRWGPGVFCECCEHASNWGYVAWVEDPSVIADDSDNWNRWGVVCWECMLMIVQAGGWPIPWTRSQT